MLSANSSESTHWRSRLAPTPSGYLHLGNACNFLLTWLWIRHLGGELWLRIDDLDQARVRPEYVEDIFQQLDWLGLDTDQGPRSVAALQQSWSQQLRTERYLSALTTLKNTGALYRCTCSRRQWQALVGEEGRYPGTCRHQQHSAEQPGSWRIRLPAAATVCWQNWPSGQEELDLADEMGDFVIQRRDGQVAYQLASCVDDLDWQMNLLIRGVDLRPSTAAQSHLLRLLEPERVHPVVLHHSLLTDEGNRKFSKSDGALSLHILREQGYTPAAVYRSCAHWQRWPEASNVQSLNDLQQSFALALKQES